MNVVFVSDDASEAKLLKSELSKLSQPARSDSSPTVKDIPVDLRYVMLQQTGITPDGLLQLPETDLEILLSWIRQLQGMKLRKLLKI